MNATNKYLDLCKAKLKVDSDYALAKELDVSTQQLSNYRSERNGADTVLAVKMAELLKLNPLRVIAEIQAESARTEKARSFWLKYSSAAAIVMMLALPYSAKSAAADAVYKSTMSGQMYIM
jgi:hypothetical protein